MKITKRLFSLVLCLAMLLTLAPVAVFADDMTPPDHDIWEDVTDPDNPTVSAWLELTVRASSAQLNAGDTVEYTVYAQGEALTTVQFVLSIPEGMTFVTGSGQIPEETKTLLGWPVMDWAGSNLTWVGYDAQATDIPEGTPLLTFSCTVNAAGTFEVQLRDTMYCDDKFESFSPNVTADTVTAVGFSDTYYLVGTINGADYGCESDHMNMGEYRFENGTLTAFFETDSYVFLKTEGNGKWLLTEANCTDTTGTFREGGQEKMFIPGEMEFVFTLVENLDGSVTLSYEPVMTTLYFDNAGTAWDRVYCYTWNGSGELNGAWPGTAMTRLEGNIYSCQVPTSVKNVIFTDGSGTQSADMTIPTDGEDLYSFYTDSWRVYNDGSDCVHSFTRYISNNDVTCSKDGTKTAQCEYCDRTDTVIDVGSAMGHLFEGEWQVEIQNTCDTEGVMLRTCSRCGAVGGDLLTEDLPSCTKSDYTDDMDQTFPAIAFEGAVRYVINLYDGSELEDGGDFLYFYAQDADGKLTLVEQCTGNLFEKVITIDAPGFVVRMTSNDSEAGYGFEFDSVEVYYEEGYQVVPAAGHSYETVVSAPTCTKQGYTTYTCSVCGYSRQDDFVPALGHDLDPDAWVVTRQPTCSRFGREDNYCLRCGARNRRNVDMVPHTFGDEWTVLQKETCTEDGLEVRTCTVCRAKGVSELIEVSHMPYLYGDDYVHNMSKIFPSVTVPGVDQLVLHFSPMSELEAGCDYLYVFAGDNVYTAPVAYLTGDLGSQTVTIPGDTFTLWMMTDGAIARMGFQVTTLTCYYTDCYRTRPADHSWTDATCTAPKTCGGCGETEGEALGHSWTDATCTAPKTCGGCGETEGEALGHSEPVYTNHGDTHSAVYPCCGGIFVEDEGHTFVNGQCVCGAVSSLKNGLVEENGALYYYVDGMLYYAGLIEIDGDYYYIRSNGQAVTGRAYWVTKTNGLKNTGNYYFDESGKLTPVTKNGLVAEDGGLYYYVDGNRYYAGLIEINGNYYYIRSNGQAVVDQLYWPSKTNGLKEPATYYFDETGKLSNKHGLVEENGVLYYYVKGKLNYAGLIQVNGDYYYIRSNGQAVMGQTYWITKTNDLLPAGGYVFGADGKMVVQKNGLIREGDAIYYYVNGNRTYAGLILLDGNYYYVRSSGQVVTGRSYWVTKTNDLLPEANYSFDADGVMINAPV